MRYEFDPKIPEPVLINDEPTDTHPVTIDSYTPKHKVAYTPAEYVARKPFFNRP